AYARWRSDFFASSRCCRCVCCCDTVPLARRFQGIWSRFRTVKIAPVNERCTGVHSGEKKSQQKPRETFHSIDANRSVTACQCLRLFHEGDQGCTMPLLEQNLTSVRGLWIEDLRIPPGQECSNGSLILLAVVLWRTFALIGRDRSLSPRRERAGSQRVMKLLKTQTIRFSQIVEKCGQPDVFILWQKPGAD